MPDCWSSSAGACSAAAPPSSTREASLAETPAPSAAAVSPSPPAGSDVPGAIDSFHKANQADPTWAEPCYSGGVIFSAIGNLAQALMQMPTEDGRTTAGPTFEYVVRA